MSDNKIETKTIESSIIDELIEQSKDKKRSHTSKVGGGVTANIDASVLEGLLSSGGSTKAGAEREESTHEHVSACENILMSTGKLRAKIKKEDDWIAHPDHRAELPIDLLDSTVDPMSPQGESRADLAFDRAVEPLKPVIHDSATEMASYTYPEPQPSNRVEQRQRALQSSSASRLTPPPHATAMEGGRQHQANSPAKSKTHITSYPQGQPQHGANLYTPGGKKFSKQDLILMLFVVVCISAGLTMAILWAIQL